MCNNISSCTFSSSLTAVNLVHSHKTLSLNKIKERIEKTLNHINYLQSSLSHRNTHGGSKFRNRNIKIKNQISLATERLKDYQLRQDKIKNDLSYNKKPTPSPEETLPVSKTEPASDNNETTLTRSVINFFNGFV